MEEICKEYEELISYFKRDKNIVSYAIEHGLIILPFFLYQPVKIY